VTSNLAQSSQFFFHTLLRLYVYWNLSLLRQILFRSFVCELSTQIWDKMKMCSGNLTLKWCKTFFSFWNKNHICKTLHFEKVYCFIRPLLPPGMEERFEMRFDQPLMEATDGNQIRKFSLWFDVCLKEWFRPDLDSPHWLHYSKAWTFTFFQFNDTIICSQCMYTILPTQKLWSLNISGTWDTSWFGCLKERWMTVMRRV